MGIRSKPPGHKDRGPEYERLKRKGDQESELGSMAHADGDAKAATEHFRKAREYWAQASEAARYD